jgi:hypothetical protein
MLNNAREGRIRRTGVLKRIYSFPLTVEDSELFQERSSSSSGHSGCWSEVKASTVDFDLQ